MEGQSKCVLSLLILYSTYERTDDISLSLSLSISGGVSSPDNTTSSSASTSLRQAAIITLYSRVTDMQNFYLLADTIPLSAHSALYNKIGWLNCIDIMNIDSRIDRFELGTC